MQASQTDIVCMTTGWFAPLIPPEEPEVLAGQYKLLEVALLHSLAYINSWHTRRLAVRVYRETTAGGSATVQREDGLCPLLAAVRLVHSFIIQQRTYAAKPDEAALLGSRAQVVAGRRTSTARDRTGYRGRRGRVWETCQDCGRKAESEQHGEQPRRRGGEPWRYGGRGGGAECARWRQGRRGHPDAVTKIRVGECSRF